MEKSFKVFQDYLSTNGIVHKVSCPYTQEQNEVVDRKHRHIVENGLSLSANAFVPLKYWDEAFKATLYL